MSTGRTWLQWGRARKDTEGQYLCGTRAYHAGCFNGAVPVRTRKAQPLRRRPCPCRSFNGAVPVRTRKDHAVPESCGPLSRFNGAVPVRTRKAPREQGRWCILFQLQWGRARKDTEGGNLVGRTGLDAEGFNGAVPVRTRKARTASRFSGAGRLLQWGRARKDTEGQQFRLHENDRVRLQWGRARKDTEGSRTMQFWSGAAVLQWGRARKDTEGSPRLNGAAQRRPASMGPCP